MSDLERFTSQFPPQRLGERGKRAEAPLPLKDEAIEGGQTLPEHIHELIKIGWEQINRMLKNGNRLTDAIKY